MKKISFLHYILQVLLLTLVPVLLNAQVIETTAQNKNINYERLAKIDDMINDYVNKHYINGAVTIVVKDNQLVQYKGYGYADVDAKTPMQKDEIFRIASQTKAVTAVGIMILYEQGKLLLDEPVSDFIPEFKNQVVLDKFNAADSSYTTIPCKERYYVSRFTYAYFRARLPRHWQ
jgi:CubicO group peptidase (beta-lactamase class C family)